MKDEIPVDKDDPWVKWSHIPPRIFVGSSSWIPGQLENELDRGVWILADAPPESGAINSLVYNELLDLSSFQHNMSSQDSENFESENMFGRNMPINENIWRLAIGSIEKTKSFVHVPASVHDGTLLKHLFA